MVPNSLFFISGAILSLSIIVSSSFVLDPAQLVEPDTALFSKAEACPVDPAPSCPLQESDEVDTCCTNQPGGYFVQTQFWDSSPPVGADDSWTVHGLWPDFCDGKNYNESCDSSRFYSNITAILMEAGETDMLNFMKLNWLPDRGPAESFWEHEWNKHGTCISTLDRKCYGDEYVPQEEVVLYFRKTVELFKSLPTYDWLAAAGIVPSATATYTLAQLQAAAVKNFGNEIIWKCKSGRYLNEAWWGYTTLGSVEHGTFVPSPRGGASINCPASGIRYLPKGSSPSPKPPASPSKLFVNVVLQDGTEKGCLIGNGKWLVGSTCAGYTLKSSISSALDDEKLVVKANDGGLILRSSRGECAFSGLGSFTCGPGVVGSSFIINNDGYLTYLGEDTFHASGIPAGTKQVDIVQGDGAKAVKLHWGSL